MFSLKIQNEILKYLLVFVILIEENINFEPKIIFKIRSHFQYELKLYFLRVSFLNKNTRVVIL